MWFTQPKWKPDTSKSNDGHSKQHSRWSWEWRKIRRSFGKKERKELLDTFEDYNTMIAQWVENIEVLSAAQGPEDDEDQARSFLNYFDQIREHACRLHSILQQVWLCNCALPHDANLRLDQRLNQQDLDFTNPSFKVSFSFSTQIAQTTAVERLWKATEIEVEELDQESIALLVLQQGIPPEMTRKPVNFSRPRPRKTVRFQSETTSSSLSSHVTNETGSSTGK
jgi:hypothetical protein